MLCKGGCKRLRQRLQTFEAKVANVCGKKMEKTGTEIVGPILDTEKGRKDSPFGSLQPSPRRFLLNRFYVIERNQPGRLSLMDWM